ncbi:cleavage and polyadenylation specificity factor subunit 4-like [Panicum hallii]|uniref:cleavage and polyadenylation specificity factor subunit 4-like n=1 Tax=Panicum hallii TaxID=206008 RepID=UPI000DF4CE0E|nr:cleavage and polyadenylation specificity factor subunit 4-like [Panicum hallii]
MGEQKRKFKLPGQFSNNSRPRFAPPQGIPFRTGGQSVNYGQNQYQRPNQQNQQQQAQRAGQSAQCPSFSQNRQNTPTRTPVRNNSPVPTGGNTFFRCGETSHYVNRCPKGNAQNIVGQFNNSGQR